METKSKTPPDIKIGVTSGLRGYFAVMYEVYEDGFSEPINTGFGSYGTRKEAEVDARQWAEADGVPVDFDEKEA